MRRRQQGITFLGLLILVTFIGLFVYAGMRLAPAYLEYMQVAKAMKDISSQLEGGTNEHGIRLAMQKRFDVEDVTSITSRDVEITRDGDMFVVHAEYDRTAPFIANVQFLVSFDNTVEIPAR